MYKLEAASSRMLSKLKPKPNTQAVPLKTSSKAKPKTQAGTKKTRSKLLSKAWKKVRSAVVLPVLRRQYIHLRNGEYEHHVNMWLDSLNRMIDKDMSGPEVASVKEMLQTKLIDERVRSRAFKAAINELNMSKDVPRAMRLLQDLRKEMYRVIGAQYELTQVLFKGAMLQKGHPRYGYSYYPWRADTSARLKVEKFFVRLYKCNRQGLMALPRYPGLTEHLMSRESACMSKIPHGKS